jgi:hypothetical protein
MYGADFSPLLIFETVSKIKNADSHSHESACGRQEWESTFFGIMEFRFIGNDT